MKNSARLLCTAVLAAGVLPFTAVPAAAADLGPGSAIGALMSGSLLPDVSRMAGATGAGMAPDSVPVGATGGLSLIRS